MKLLIQFTKVIPADKMCYFEPVLQILEYFFAFWESDQNRYFLPVIKGINLVVLIESKK